MSFYQSIRNRLKRKPLSYFDSCRVKYGTQITTGENIQFGDYTTINIASADSALIMGNNISFRNYCNILLYEKATLHIGDLVFFNNYCSLNCLGKITIGQNSIFGEGVKVYDHNHRYELDESGRLDVKRNEFTINEVKIGKNCWIGSNVTILKGVEIGDNVIIGANCLIYKSVPANTIVKLNVELIAETR